MQQALYEDVQVGQDIPAMSRRPNGQQLVKWAGAVHDFDEIHFDKEAAQSAGLKGVLVHGSLTLSFLGQLLTDWAGPEGRVRRFGVTYRGMNFVNEEIVLRGKVTNKYERDGNHLVELEIWAEDAKGEKNSRGTAIVSLPSRTRG